MARAPEFEQAKAEHKKQYPELNTFDTEAQQEHLNLYESE